MFEYCGTLCSMGGGWGKQGSGIPMSERVRAGSAAPGARG